MMSLKRVHTIEDIANRLISLKPSYEQYQRNYLWFSLFIILLNDNNDNPNDNPNDIPNDIVPKVPKDIDNKVPNVSKDIDNKVPKVSKDIENKLVSIIRFEAKRHTKGDLYLYLHHLLMGITPVPLYLEPYLPQLFLSITFLTGCNPTLITLLPPITIHQASVIARRDINKYLSSCINIL